MLPLPPDTLTSQHAKHTDTHTHLHTHTHTHTHTHMLSHRIVAHTEKSHGQSQAWPLTASRGCCVLRTDGGVSLREADCSRSHPNSRTFASETDRWIGGREISDMTKKE